MAHRLTDRQTGQGACHQRGGYSCLTGLGGCTRPSPGTESPPEARAAAGDPSNPQESVGTREQTRQQRTLTRVPAAGEGRGGGPSGAAGPQVQQAVVQVWERRQGRRGAPRV